jgi:hypothetical protein
MGFRLRLSSGCVPRSISGDDRKDFATVVEDRGDWVKTTLLGECIGDEQGIG